MPGTPAFPAFAFPLLPGFGRGRATGLRIAARLCVPAPLRFAARLRVATGLRVSARLRIDAGLRIAAALRG